MKWFHRSTGGGISLSAGQSLVKDVIQKPTFDKAHFDGFRIEKELKRLDDLENDPTSHFPVQDRWKTSSVSISVPKPGGSRSIEDAPKFTANNVHHRSLLDLIKSALEEPAAQHFHINPYKEFAQMSGDQPDERLTSEMYTSDAFLKAQDEVNAQVKKDQCNLPAVVLAILAFSDATCLTNFGHAELWPIYVYFVNLSKYARRLAESFSAHHLAYIPKVWDHHISQINTHALSVSSIQCSVTGIWRHMVKHPHRKSFGTCDESFFMEFGACSWMKNS
ncbi:hypothetical protein BKA70DRAFT_1122293 [Coprinopsis sp. MPI-PUGE-AT-0042]|nr:hypothetical protein BKA70DRAFT_1122293 [Coprinopsis sp. MPI-PUGE-AT-0042]